MDNSKPLVIDVHHLSKSFAEQKAVVDVSLQVKQGEIFGFLGPNGSGKTTTIRMICGLLTPDAGTGTCLGFNVIKEARQIKSQVGYMTQKFGLYEDLSVSENLDFIARMYNINPRKKLVENCIKMLGLTHRKNQLAGQLSGGWKQRLALAAATLHKPQLLLLDEPTAGVDPKARREFWEQINRLSNEGVTCLVSTHYMDEAERCHRLAYIAYGHLLATGTIEEVINMANFTTWEVRGSSLSKLMNLADELRCLPTISEVAMFGQALHVSWTSEEDMQQDLLRYQNLPGLKWLLIKPSLEDVFIYFMKYADQNFSK